MKFHNIIVLLALIIGNFNNSMGQTLTADEADLYLSLISRINDTTFNACTCMAVDRNSSFLPNHRHGIEFALMVERKIDPSFPRCVTISRNDSLFYNLHVSDMERIQMLYEEWFKLWKKDPTITKRPLDGTEYKWVNLEGPWLKEVQAY